MTKYEEHPFPGLPSISELTDESNSCRHDRLPFDPPLPECSCWNIGWKPPMSKKDQFIAAFRAHAERLGRPPSRKEWDNPPPPGLGSFVARKLFGSWSEAIRAAGYEPNTPQTVPRKPRRTTPMAERFWRKVKKTESCWLWTGCLGTHGYGDFNLGGRRGTKNRSAHVVAYELTIGPVPEGLELDHLCRTRACVNPDHLEPVTHAVNSQRGAVAKLTMEQAHEIRSSVEDSRVVAARFGICRNQVYEIRGGRSWLPDKPGRRAA